LNAALPADRALSTDAGAIVDVRVDIRPSRDLHPESLTMRIALYVLCGSRPRHLHVSVDRVVGA
jgi:hypothetical protein